MNKKKENISITFNDEAFYHDLVYLLYLLVQLEQFQVVLLVLFEKTLINL